MRRIWERLSGRPNTMALAIITAGVFLSLFYDTRQDTEREKERERQEQIRSLERVELAANTALHDCLAANNTRQLIREIGVQLAVAPNEALITVATAQNPDIDPAVIQALRDGVLANAQQTVSVLGDQDCDAEAQIARREAERTEGVAP